METNEMKKVWCEVIGQLCRGTRRDGKEELNFQGYKLDPGRCDLCEVPEGVVELFVDTDLSVRTRTNPNLPGFVGVDLSSQPEKSFQFMYVRNGQVRINHNLSEPMRNSVGLLETIVEENRAKRPE